MECDPEIKVGQVWVAKRADKLKSNGQVTVLNILRNWIEIEGYLSERDAYRKRWISSEGLRRKYRLQAEQESLL